MSSRYEQSLITSNLQNVSKINKKSTNVGRVSLSYQFSNADRWPTAQPDSNRLAVVSSGSPYIAVYTWDSATGFGTKFANPTEALGSVPSSVKFHPDRNAIVACMASTSGEYAYQWNDDTGFGAKYTNPSPWNFATYRVDFSPSGKSILISYVQNPSVVVGPWSYSTGVGTNTSVVNAPSQAGATQMSAGAPSATFSPRGDYFVVGSTSPPYLHAYRYDESTYQMTASYINPSVTSGNVPRQIIISTDNKGQDFLITAHGTSDLSGYLQAYKFDVRFGFGTKYDNLGQVTGQQSISTSAGYGVALTPSGKAVILATVATPYVYAYPWNTETGFGVSYSNPSTLPAGGSRGVAINNRGDAIAVAHAGTPHVSVYRWDDATGFGTKYSNPNTLPPTNGYSAAFN